jgi:hypothetical protein
MSWLHATLGQASGPVLKWYSRGLSHAVEVQ